MDIWKIAVACNARGGELLLQGNDVEFERIPLLGGKLIRADQTNADRAAILPGGMRADFIQMATGGDRAIGVNNEVVADAGEFRVLTLAKFRRPLEPAFTMPGVDIGNGLPPPVGRRAAMNHDEVYFARHARRLRARAGMVKPEALP